MSEINDIFKTLQKHDLNIKISSFLCSCDVNIFNIYIKILIEIAFYVLELNFLPFHHLCFCQSLISLIFYGKKRHVSLFLSLLNPKMAVIYAH